MRNEQPAQQIEESEHVNQNADKHLSATGASHLVGIVSHWLSDQWNLECSFSERPEWQQTSDTQQENFEDLPA